MILYNPETQIKSLIRRVENESTYLYSVSRIDRYEMSQTLQEILSELKHLQSDLNHDYGCGSWWQKWKQKKQLKEGITQVKVHPNSIRNQVLSLILRAKRDEENRYESASYAYQLSPLWLKLDEAIKLLITHPIKKEN